MLVSWVFSRISCYIFRTNLEHVGPVIVVQLWDWLPVGITWLHTPVQEMGASQAAVGSYGSKQRCENRGAPLARGALRREHWVGREKQIRLRQGSKIKRREPLGPPDHLPCPSYAHWQALGQHLSSTSFSSAAYKCCVPLCPLDRTWSLAVSSQRGSHITEDADFSIWAHALGDFKNLSLDPAIPLLEIYRIDMEI